MAYNLFKGVVKEDFVVIDHQFPQKDPFAFKNAEINQYFQKIKNFKSYTMHPMLPDSGAWFNHGYGVAHEEFLQNKEGYLEHYEQNPDRIQYLWPDKKYRIKLAYSYFLAETYVLLPFFEKHKVPFVFVLYPGGAFGLNFDTSDEMLKRIFQSKYFRGVITTQEITRQYLLSKELCKAEAIYPIYGGFVQFQKSEVLPKRQYKRDKKTFDICFVAAKYSERGVDKGYDLFIEAAKVLVKSTDDVRFHVVGGFNENEIATEELKGKIRFYGYRKPDFLLEFYRDMDIFLSPNRPNALFEGNFDGFPLGADAAYCGVALFVSDELKMNKHYTNGKDIQIIKLDAAQIASSIFEFYNDVERLYNMSVLGQMKAQKLFDIDVQVGERIKVFDNICKLKLY